MHLTDAQLDGYLARSLDGSVRKDLEGHIDSCFRCTLRLESAAAQPERWDRRGPLGRLVRASPL